MLSIKWVGVYVGTLPMRLHRYAASNRTIDLQTGLPYFTGKPQEMYLQGNLGTDTKKNIKIVHRESIVHLGESLD